MVSVVYEHCLQGLLSHFVVSTIITVLLQVFTLQYKAPSGGCCCDLTAALRLHETLECTCWTCWAVSSTILLTTTDGGSGGAAGSL